MKRKILLTCLIVLSANSIILSQNRISANLGYGYYLSNSENSLIIMEKDDFTSYFNFGFAFQRNNLFGYNILLEYNYHEIKEDDVIQFFRTSSRSPEIIGFYYGDMTLTNHNIDLDFVGVINEYLLFGFGPSFVISNRTLVIDDLLKDKLASSGIGVNGFIRADLPLSNDKEYFYISAKLNLRYTHSIWFDEGLRNLDNYNQEFFTSNILIGLGYSF